MDDRPHRSQVKIPFVRSTVTVLPFLVKILLFVCNTDWWCLTAARVVPTNEQSVQGKELMLSINFRATCKRMVSYPDTSYGYLLNFITDCLESCTFCDQTGGHSQLCSRAWLFRGFANFTGYGKTLCYALLPFVFDHLSLCATGYGFSPTTPQHQHCMVRHPSNVCRNQ